MLTAFVIAVCPWVASSLSISSNLAKVHLKHAPDEVIASKVESWTPLKGSYVWEESGKFEGDIMLRLTGRNAVRNTDLLWPDGIVPYEINTTRLDTKAVKIIKEVIKLYHLYTCIRFVEKRPIDTDYLLIKGENNGCYSFVGRQGGEQIVNLQPHGCLHHGTIIHELLHSLGFYHLQSSTDRDDYVSIIWDNIAKDDENNFQKFDEATISNLDFPYDYSSIMHYSQYAFSRNGEPTIMPKFTTGDEIGQRVFFSRYDLLKLEKLYKSECRKRPDLETKTVQGHLPDTNSEHAQVKEVSKQDKVEITVIENSNETTTQISSVLNENPSPRTAKIDGLTDQFDDKEKGTVDELKQILKSLEKIVERLSNKVEKRELSKINHLDIYRGIYPPDEGPLSSMYKRTAAADRSKSAAPDTQKNANNHYTEPDRKNKCSTSFQNIRPVMRRPTRMSASQRTRREQIGERNSQKTFFRIQDKRYLFP